MSEKRSVTKKMLIVETALSLFIEKGFHQTSIRDIANKAGISLGNLYNHFSGKSELICAIALVEADEQLALESILINKSSPLTVLESFIDQYFLIHAQPEDAAITAEILAEAIRNPEVASGFAGNRIRLINKLEFFLNAGRESSNFNFVMAPNLIAQSIIDLLESASINSIFLSPVEKEQYCSHTKELIFNITSSRLS